MKALYTIAIFLTLSQTSFSQISFLYDNAGQRIKRGSSEALPVTLVEFTARPNVTSDDSPEAYLEWKTDAEYNASTFEISRSLDGKAWEVIGVVDALSHGEVKATYAFYDHRAKFGDNMYRLKMTDTDGKFAFSKICVAFVPPRNEPFPNPVSHILYVPGSDDNRRLQLFDVRGNLMIHTRLLPGTGLPVQYLPTGVYILKVPGNNTPDRIYKILKE